MRGPETAQFGLTLSLLARYFHYTGDSALLLKHRAKIEATAALLVRMHEDSLRLPKENSGYGLIHGWSESDACLAPQPATWWRPYFGNSAFAARGLTDIAQIWPQLNSERNKTAAEVQAREWRDHASSLQAALVKSIQQNIRRDLQTPYIGPLPGAKLTFRESLEQEHPSPQQWPHRPYSELLQADMLPPELANLVIDCMRAYGATTLGVVANVGRANPRGRAILGFISYGYAQMLLRLDRIEEYLLFLQAHRFHDHTRGSWTAGEVAGITGGTALFCIPAQQTIPLLVRWMLVLEDSDKDLLYLAKGLPREWVASGKEIRIEQAPTRWGKVTLRVASDVSKKTATAHVQFHSPRAPKEVQVKFRLPALNAVKAATVNGQASRIGGVHQDCVVFETGSSHSFDIAVQLS